MANHSTNFQQTGRELLTADELRMLDNDKAIVLIRGEKPVIDLKYDIMKHPNVKYTADGEGKEYEHGVVDRAIGTVSLLGLEEIKNLQDTKEMKEVKNITYELLSEEDIKEKNKIMNKTKKNRILKRTSLVLWAVFALTITQVSTVFGADDPLTVINNLSTFIFGIIRAIGMILLGWGIVQVGLALKSHDASQRANGFLTLAGGVIITFAKEILDLITGG